jgi:DNA-binding MarR family transcriptional regulator
MLSQELDRQSTLAVMLSQTIAEQLGLSPTDLECLGMLGKQALTAGKLAEKARLTAGAITGVIDRLERAGDVQRVRDQQDRRRVIVQPCTEKIEREINPFFASFASTFQELYACYNE